MHFVVSVPLDPDLASLIGKKGSGNGITFYNRRIDENTIVALTPSSIEEKFYVTAQSMLLSSQIIVSTVATDRLFGEVLLACSLLDRHVIFTKDNDISKFIAGIAIKSSEFVERAEVAERILKGKPGNGVGETRVDIDRAFPVKGLGTVVLGIVTRGTVKVHDELRHSNGKSIIVRSMQSQDVDITEAEVGTRVGLAVKGMEHDEFERGDILSQRQIPKASTIKAKLALAKMAGEDIGQGRKYWLASNFSYTMVTVESIDGDVATLRAEKQIPMDINDEFLLLRRTGPKNICARKGNVLTNERWMNSNLHTPYK